MDIKEKIARINAAMFALQVEILAASDSPAKHVLAAALFALQMQLADLYKGLQENGQQIENPPAMDGLDIKNPHLNAASGAGAEIPQNCDKQKSGLLIFSEKELIKMPTEFRKIFRAQGCVVHYRERRGGKYVKSYEARYAKKPYNRHPISVSAPTLDKLKLRFIEKVKNYSVTECSTPIVPKVFDGFALYWFENFHRKKVAEKTYKKNLSTYKRDIQKIFGQIRLTDILPAQIQNFLDGYSNRERTKETLHSLLNQIFDCAIKHGILKLNPLDMCVYLKHEREHGIAFTKVEEKQLLIAYAETPFGLGFAVAMYTGLRPNEYQKARIVGKFIIVQNSKRKNGKIEYKKIPINPMLRPYLSGVDELNLFSPSTYAKRLKSLFPSHALYDMRTTFQTRCTEQHVAEVAIGLFMGNGIGGELKKAYTDVSDEWLLAESEKIKYNLPAVTG